MQYPTDLYRQYPDILAAAGFHAQDGSGRFPGCARIDNHLPLPGSILLDQQIANRHANQFIDAITEVAREGRVGIQDLVAVAHVNAVLAVVDQRPIIQFGLVQGFFDAATRRDIDDRAFEQCRALAGRCYADRHCNRQPVATQHFGFMAGSSSYRTQLPQQGLAMSRLLEPLVVSIRRDEQLLAILESENMGHRIIGIQQVSIARDAKNPHPGIFQDVAIIQRAFLDGIIHRSGHNPPYVAVQYSQ